MSLKLLINAMSKFMAGVLSVSALIFIPAGTFKFINAWILIATTFIPMFIAGIIMMIKSPELLNKRLDANETRGKQKLVIFASALILIFGFITAGLNFRFKWHTLSSKTSICAVIALILAYIMYAVVLYQNKNLSRTIKIYENQKLIQTGLYGIIRHPMYFATIILFLSFPLILGCIYSLYIFLLYPVLIVIRIIDEEKMLNNDLEGYKKYSQKVKYRLIPFIW